MPSRKSKSKTKTRPLDWAKYTDFRSKHSKSDLDQLCSRLEREQIEDEFNTPDEAGLYPIHWAAIHNRSDLIEYMIDNGSPIKAKCSNKLFADGTALHLAAMNGSIEAAEKLLAKCDERGRSQTKAKSNDQSQSGQTAQGEKSEALKWLESRDSEGQTPLMRSAAPRSKRLDTIRDLLRKNLWSLSGRPAEMALFLINAGADWRQTDSKFGMNLLHWAIANDYDDIVNMLLIIDKELLNVKAKLAPAIEEPRLTINPDVTKPKPLANKPSKKEDGFVSIDLKGTSSKTSSASSNSSDPAGGSARKPLLAETRREQEKSFRAKLASDGLTPLQLAIVYGRISVINLLWLLTNSSKTKSNSNSTVLDKQESPTTKWSRKRELRSILMRAYWASKTELARLMRSALLKLALVLDLTLLTLIWMPGYLGSDPINRRDFMVCDVMNGAFIIAYCISLALACRVMLKNPGFLRRSSIQYLSELTFLVSKRAPVQQSPDKSASENLAGAKANGEQKVEVTPARSELQTGADKRQFKIIKPIRPARQKGDSPLPNEMRVTERVRLLCHKCRCIRRPRSRHCNSCNHCVQEFDHHCIYLGCCIGRENRFDFLLMMVMVSLTAIYGTVLYSISPNSRQSGNFRRVIGSIWVSKYILIGVLSCFFILRRACLGVTMFEQIRSNRIRRIFGRAGPPDDISRSHKYFSTKRDSFWRYAPDRFLTGDLPMKKVWRNFREFTTYASIGDYFLSMACPDTALARSLTSSDSKVDLYKFV